MADELQEREKNRDLREALGDLQRYIEQLTSFLPMAFCVVTPVGTIITVNRFFKELTSYTDSEIVGQPVEMIFAEKKAVVLITEEVRKKGNLEKEIVLLNKKGEKIPADIFASLRKDQEGNVLGYFLGIIEIARFKKFEVELEKGLKEKTKELEERTKALENSRKGLLNILEDIDEAKNKAEEEKNKTLAIITNLADGLLVFDERNNLSLISPQAENFFNISKKEVINLTLSELTKFPGLASLIKILTETLTVKENQAAGNKPGLKEIFRKEFTLKEDLLLEVSAVPLMKEEEKTGTLVILHDITREKTIERMKTEFVSLAAHQLRTPLSAIKWTLKILLDGDLGELNPEQRDFVQKTYKSNERMIDLINALLDVARIEEGRYLYKPNLAEFEPIVQFVVNSYKEEIEKKGLKLEFQKPEEKLPKVMLDVEKIRLVLQNLIDNAVKYTPPGGQLTISIKDAKKEIEFSIKDSGVGIPQDQQERVFTKFFRAANVMRMDTEGTGLGLFISKNIIEAHKGRLWFESTDQGTTFYFTLPIRSEFEEFITGF